MKRMSLGMVLLLGTLLTVPLVACGDGDGDGDGNGNGEGEPTVTASGLQIIDIEVGTGDSPQSGQTVEVHYTGWLADGTKFDSSLDKGQPFSFVLGAGRVIAGWDEGVASMKVGGKRRLIIPPELGYGASGYPPVIPANAELTFDVELLAIK